MDDLAAGMLIRPARDGEHVALTELVLRSVQQTWNYPQEFMEWEPETITVGPQHVRDMLTNVAEEHGRIVGFYVLDGTPPEMEMSRLMIEPDRVGTGIGRMLWNHAVATAVALGVQTITIDGDPNAEPFYRRMGAVTVGEHDWSPPMMPGWRVKKMRFDIPA